MDRSSKKKWLPALAIEHIDSVLKVFTGHGAAWCLSLCRAPPMPHYLCC
jgi:hypothetical protein